MPAATAVKSGASLEKRCGAMLRVKNGFGFIVQDCGDKDMFVMPASCKAFGGIFPPLGLRVSYSVVVDGKTGRPRAENVRPEAGSIAPEKNVSANRKGVSSGVMARKKDNSFGFIQQDSCEDDMFVMPNACDAFGGSLPAVGTRVFYTVVRDMKTQKPRAEHVKPAMEDVKPAMEDVDTNKGRCQGLPTLLQLSNPMFRSTAQQEPSKTHVDETVSKPMLSDARPLRSNSMAETDAGSEYTSCTSGTGVESETLSTTKCCNQRDEDTVQPVCSDTPSAAAHLATYTLHNSERSRPEQLKRTVQSLVNKICPENIQTVCARIASEAEVHNAEELELVVRIVVKKALMEVHYSETYADLVYHLAAVLPKFPSSVAGKSVTVKSILLNVCQDEYDDMRARFQPGSKPVDMDTCCDWSELKARFLANMRFIGNLFLRQLVSIRLILAILADLLDVDSPEEHAIECVCQLLLSIGYTLESIPVGKAFLSQVIARLEGLKEPNNCTYSKRMKFCIQDLLEVRAAGWAKKTFKGLAQTKMEIKQKQEEDMKATGAGMQTELANTLIAGGRPACLSEDSH
jgi:cold shock CspA family protein